MKEYYVLIRYTEKAIWLILLIGLSLYYPGKLIFDFVTGYIAVFVAELKTFEGVTGVKELVIIDGFAAFVLGGISIFCAWLLFKRHKKSMVAIFSFLFITLVYYLMEPVWVRISGFPVDIFSGQLYENPFNLLRPVGAGIVFGIYFFILNNTETAARKLSHTDSSLKRPGL